MIEENFARDVLDAFQPVIAHAKFCCAYADGRVAQLEGNGVVLKISYDSCRSYEVGVEFAREDGEDGKLVGGVPFNLGEVFRLFAVPNADERWFYQSANYTSVMAFLREVAETLVECCSPVLRGDALVFDSLLEQRRHEAAAYTARVNLQAVKPLAIAAWQDRRYADYVRLLKPFADALSDSEKRQLTYAEKHQS